MRSDRRSQFWRRAALTPKPKAGPQLGEFAAHLNVDLRTGTRDPRCGRHGAAGDRRNFEDMLALDVNPLAKQDLDVRLSKTEWPK
jgi:hypothetical protein